jgi:hypothetical protein
MRRLYFALLGIVLIWASSCSMGGGGVTDDDENNPPSRITA